MLQELEEARSEAATLVEILESRQAGLVTTLEGNFPELRATVWQSESSVQAAVQTLTPQMTENKKKVPYKDSWHDGQAILPALGIAFRPYLGT